MIVRIDTAIFEDKLRAYLQEWAFEVGDLMPGIVIKLDEIEQEASGDTALVSMEISIYNILMSCRVPNKCLSDKLKKS